MKKKSDIIYKQRKNGKHVIAKWLFRKKYFGFFRHTIFEKRQSQKGEEYGKSIRESVFQ